MEMVWVFQRTTNAEKHQAMTDSLDNPIDERAGCELLNVQEAAQHLQLSRSYLYKLMSRHELPYYKPGGKKAFFKQRDLDAYMQRNLIKSIEQIQSEAQEYLHRSRQRGNA